MGTCTGERQKTSEREWQRSWAWELIAWPTEYQQVMYRDWGDFFTPKQQLEAAIKYYNKSLELRKDDTKALLHRSKCLRLVAKAREALNDSLKAAEYNPDDVHVDAEICQNLYELNQFENCLIESHDDTRKYVGAKSNMFRNNIVVVEENMKDSMGKSLSPFILKNGKYFKDVLENVERKEHVETRPLWKVLRDEGKCDVMSIQEFKKELLSPREAARRQQAYRVFNQIYFGKSWNDLIFLKEMRTNPVLMWKASKQSVPLLHHLIESKYAVVKKFLKMLQARSPLYNELLTKFGNKKMWDAYREKHLNRVQYSTRRAMNSILQTIKKLRQERKCEELAKYVETVMGDYVVLKTKRVMCWKFEFLNEVYNILALAFTDIYMITDDDLKSRESSIMLKVLHLPTQRHKPNVPFVFGDKSTYQEPDAVDEKFEAYKRFIGRLEKRMLFAKWPIESTYLYHEIARAHLKNGRFDECCSVARKGIEAAKSCNSNIYAFLNCMLIVKAHALLQKVERCRDALDEAAILVKSLKNQRLDFFVEICSGMNDYEIAMKKKFRSTMQSRTKMSGSSLGTLSNTPSRRQSVSTTNSYKLSSREGEEEAEMVTDGNDLSTHLIDQKRVRKHVKARK